MSISIPRKLIIKFAAAGDAHGAYGQYLIDRQKSEMARSLQLNLSSYMAQLVINYTKKSQQKATRNFYLRWQYRKIMNQCKDMEIKIEAQKTDTESVSAAIEEVDHEIQRLQKELGQLKDSWDYINNSGQPMPGMAIMTISDLAASIDGVSNSLKTNAEKKVQLQAQLDKARTNANTQTKAAYDRLVRFVLKYQHKVERLYGTITAYGSLCDEYLNYYWRSLCNSLSKQHSQIIHEQPKAFAEICNLRGSQLTSKNELFRKERDELNKRLASFSGFETRL